MVGGPAPDVRDERICRFEFPERPGALMKFLDTLGGRWNISLFHYRNHGADFGRVLVGFEVPDGDAAEFARFLERARLSVPHASRTTKRIGDFSRRGRRGGCQAAGDGLRAIRPQACSL